MQDDKYVVFKKDVWEGTMECDLPDLQPLDDAVVIRTQDLFAGPALWVYAHVLGLAAKTQSDPEVGKRLGEIADYFSLRATEAGERLGKVPD